MSDQFGGLPQAPQPPEGWGSEPATPRGPAPKPVENAVRLMLLSALFGLISTVALFLQKDELKKQLLKNSKTSSISSSDVNTVLTVSAVISLVILVLYVLLALQVRKGRNWARIVTWVLSGIGLLNALTSLGSNSTTAVARTLTLVQGLIDLAIIVFLARRESSRYFAQPRR